jgi:hypothetical protein
MGVTMRFEVRKEPNEPDFEIVEFRCVSTRGAIVAVLLGLTTLFLIGAGIYGWWHNDFSGLTAVADYTKVPLGMLLGYYFGVRYEQGNQAGANGDAGGGL